MFGLSPNASKRKPSEKKKQTLTCWDDNVELNPSWRRNSEYKTTPFYLFYLVNQLVFHRFETKKKKKDSRTIER